MPVKYSTAMRTRWPWPAVIMAAWLIATPVEAADVWGLVQGPTRVALAGVSVELIGNDGRTRSVVTGSDGVFMVRDVPPGPYQAVVRRAARELVRVTGVVTDTLRVDLRIVIPPVPGLTFGGAAGPAGAARQETAAAATVSERSMQFTPLRNDRFVEALALIPGVVLSRDGLIAIAGARASEAGFLINGMDGSDPVTLQFGVKMPLDAVTSAQVIQSPYPPQSGWLSAGLASITTKPAGEKWYFEANSLVPRFHFDGGLRGIESFQPRARLSGPLSRRLSFAQAVDYKLLKLYVYDQAGSTRPTRLESFDSATQIDYAPSSTHRMSGLVAVFPDKTDADGLGVLRPLATTANVHQTGVFASVRDTRLAAGAIEIESQIAIRTGAADVYPNGNDPYDLTPEGVRGHYFSTRYRDSVRYEFKQQFSFAVGPRRLHELRAGVSVAHAEFDGVGRQRTVRVLRGDGTLAQQIDFGPGAETTGRSTTTSLFFSDRWTPRSALTLDGGLRYDRDSLSGQGWISPRISYALALAEGRSVIKGGWGVFVDKLSLNAGGFAGQPSRTVTTFAGSGQPTTESSVTFINAAPEQLRQPRSIVWNTEYNHLVGRVLLRVNYVERYGSDSLIVEPRVDGSGAWMALSNGGESVYRAFELSTRVPTGDNAFFLVSYVRSSATGSLNDFARYFGDQPAPLVYENEIAPLASDVPHRLLAWGTFSLPRDFVVAPVLEWRSGFPYSTLDEEQQFVGGQHSHRFPAAFQADIRVSKIIRIASRRVRIGLKVLNITGHFNPREVQNNIDSPYYGRFFNSPGRQYRGTFQIYF